LLDQLLSRVKLDAFLADALDLDTPVIELPLRAVYLQTRKGDLWALAINQPPRFPGFGGFPAAALLHQSSSAHDAVENLRVNLDALRVVKTNDLWNVVRADSHTHELLDETVIGDVVSLRVEPWAPMRPDEPVARHPADPRLCELAATAYYVSTGVDIGDAVRPPRPPGLDIARPPGLDIDGRDDTGGPGAPGGPLL
jgi:hypothetical protein